ncbi:unnamed protein product [Calypogeia fissa]
MRAVLQRVLSARVEVEGRVVSSIGPGILVLVGLLDTDTEADAEYICRKILNTRLFPNEKTGKGWDLSVMQQNYEVLLVSQFTLYGQLKGNKLDFHVAMPPERAKPFYESLVQRVSNAYRADAVKDGLFGAMMQVHLVNDGPVTIQLDTQKANGKEANESGRQDAGVQAGYKVGEGSASSKLYRFHPNRSRTKMMDNSSWLQSVHTQRTPRVTIVKNPYGTYAASQLKYWLVSHSGSLIPCKFC